MYISVSDKKNQKVGSIEEDEDDDDDEDDCGNVKWNRERDGDRSGCLMEGNYIFAAAQYVRWESAREGWHGD